MVSLFLPVFFCLSIVGAWAGKPARELFSDAALTAALRSKQDQERQDPTITRNRYVHIDFALLQDASVILNLFDDMVLTVDKVEIKEGFGNLSIWKGKIKGAKGSNVTLTYGSDGSLFGSIRTMEGDYQVRRVANDLYGVYQIDQSGFVSTSVGMIMVLKRLIRKVPQTSFLQTC